MEDIMDDICVADVKPEPVTWLWQGRIPKGMLTIIGGIPGQGKSWMTLDLAARISRGGTWPDGRAAPLGNVLLLSGEDVLNKTIRPRLDKLGADPQRIFQIRMIRSQGKERHFDLSRDLELLERKIQERQVTLVIIDPVTAYLGKLDSFKDAEVRAVLAPVAALAERYDVAIIAIMHLTKDQARPAIHRFSGSGGFTAAPRAVFAVAPDPHDPERKFFVAVKLSLDVKPPTLAFRIDASGPVWEPQSCTADPDNILAGDDEWTDRDEAKKFLIKELVTGNGEVAVKRVVGAARQAAISDRTLRRAKKDLGIASRRDGATGTWYWVLSTTTQNVATLTTTIDNTADNTEPYGNMASGHLDEATLEDVAALKTSKESKVAKAATLPLYRVGHLANGHYVNWDDIKEDGE